MIEQLVNGEIVSLAMGITITWILIFTIIAWLLTQQDEYTIWKSVMASLVLLGFGLIVTSLIITISFVVYTFLL